MHFDRGVELVTPFTKEVCASNRSVLVEVPHIEKAFLSRIPAVYDVTRSKIYKKSSEFFRKLLNYKRFSRNVERSAKIFGTTPFKI